MLESTPFSQLSVNNTSLLTNSKKKLINRESSYNKNKTNLIFDDRSFTFQVIAYFYLQKIIILMVNG